MARDAKTNPAVNEASRSAVLDEIVRRVIEVAEPDRIILFGSAARGQMGPDSDIDLLVIKGGIASRRTLAQHAGVAAATALGNAWTKKHYEKAALGRGLISVDRTQLHGAHTALHAGTLLRE